MVDADELDLESLIDVTDDSSDELKPGSPAATGQVALPRAPKPSRRQLLSQVLFGIALGSVLFFLFGNSREGVVEANLVDATDSVSVSGEPPEAESNDNFGIGDLEEADSRPALPRSDLPGVTSTTLGPSQKAPSTIVVEIVGSADDGSSTSPALEGPVDEYKDDFPSPDAEAADNQFFSNAGPYATTTPGPFPVESSLAPATTSAAAENPTSTVTTSYTNDSAEGGDDAPVGDDDPTDNENVGEDDQDNAAEVEDSETTTTSVPESTTELPNAVVQILEVVDSGSSGLQLSASPYEDHTYCWTIGYETSGESSRFCTQEANTSSPGIPVFGTATASLEIYTFLGDSIGTDTVTLEFLTQSVIQRPTASDSVLIGDSVRVKSNPRPELTLYCWNFFQGSVSVLHCGAEHRDVVDLDEAAFEPGPGSLRAQVYVGPEDARRLVGSEEIQIEFE